MITKVIFHFVSSKCYMCILLTCDWREDYRFRMSSSLLLQCIVCNSKTSICDLNLKEHAEEFVIPVKQQPSFIHRSYALSPCKAEPI